MPWYNQWSDSLKKRACRYLLQRYLGQFLEEKLTLDQLTVDLYNGTGSVSGVVLDVHALNELGDQENLPIEFVDGYVSEMSVSIPLSQLFTDSSYIEVTGLLLTVQPKKRACDGGSMFESMWNSMSNSMQLAAECLQQTVDEKETEGANLMEGLELFASAIDSVLTRVKIKFVNTILRLEHVPIKGVNGIAVEIRISNIDYCDEACSDPMYAETSPQTTYQSSTFSIKKFHCESINLYTDEFPAASRTFSRSVIMKQDYDQSNCHAKSGNDAILFGKLSGRQEIRLKLKQDDSVLGPKVDIELSLGSLTLFLSPRQMHLIVELVHSLGSPHTQDTSNVEPKNFSQKPMNICDYKKVEQELQENISSLPSKNKLKEKHQTNPGWSSASIEEIDEEFFPMKGNTGVSDSIISETAMDTSVGSTFTSATDNSKCSCVSLENSASWSGRQRASRKGLSSVGEGDFSGEMTGFNIRLASLSVVLLHSDVLIFDADSFSLTPTSVSLMKNLSSNFFQSLGVYEIQGYGNKDFTQVKNLLSSACMRCHIRLIATTLMVEGSEKGNDWSRSVDVVLTTASFQATECIYSEKTNQAENSPHFVELLNFMRSNEDSVKPHFPISGLPDVRLHFLQQKKFRNSNPNAFVKLDISFSITMQQCWTEVDLSIIDRISAIIHLENVCQSTNLTKETRHELSSFSKAVETSLADVKFDFKLSTPFLIIKFRFPIPDLRPVHDLERSPWWKRNVRKDILYFNLIEPSVRSESNNRTYLQSYKMYCSEIVALFQEGSANVPVAFARATHNKYGTKPTKIGQCIGLPCISFRINPKEIVTELEETDDGPSCSQSCFIETPSKQPSPFRSKHVVHGNSDTGGSEPNKLAESYGEELIVPANKQEMNDFINLATRTARIQVDVSLPFVAVHFPSKHFYEVLYNRFNSDLSLWQTSAQKLHSSDTGNNCHLDDYSRHPLFPAFSLCKSGLFYDSDSDSDDISPGISQMNNTKSKQKKAVKLNGQSKYSLNIAVSQGLFNIETTLKEVSGNSAPELHGELQINVEEGSVFIVNNFKGVPQQNYVCLLVSEAALYFKDVCKQASHNSSPLFSPNINPSHLSPTIYFQHTAASNKPAASESSKNMLRAAIHTEVNENKVKIIKVSCGLQSATLQHKVCLPQHTWLTQLMEFFDVIDYPVRGYDSPQVVTELHQHLWDCAIDYRPLNLPLKSVVTIGSLSLSSNIAARTKSSTFRFITEEANLFISNKMNNTSNMIDLKKDYVSVIELGLFELSLRLSDSVKCPKVDLKALINIVNIRTCSDSARALAQLIKYFASDGDLNNTDTNEVTPAVSLPSTDRQGTLSEGTLSESTVERVNNMMEDAMLDDQNDAAKSEQSIDMAEEAKDVDVFIFPDEGALIDTSVPVDWCGSDLESEHDFCLLEHEAGSGIMPKSGMPEVRMLASPIVVIDNYFSLAVGKADLLLPPKHYPSPVFRYTLQDMTLIWHMYGGLDFGSNKKTESYVITTPQGESSSSPRRKKCYVDTVIDETNAERQSHKTYEDNRMWSDDIATHRNQKTSTTSNKSTKWYTKGGCHRNTNILMQLQLNKVKFQHDVYPERGVQASRQVLLVHELEVRDRLSTSSINKFLYQYTSEASPRQSHANMVVVKAVHVRPDPRRNVQETCLKLSLLPLRLNIDQDSLVFLITFFSQLSGTNNEGGGDESQTGANMHQVPVMGVEKDENMGLEPNKRKDNQPSLLIMFDEDVNYPLKPTPPPPSSNEPASTSPLYIRSFVFSPDVPIRIDYEGKRVDMTHGSLAGLLMGLGQLSCLQLKLKKLSYRHGILGFDKLVSYVVSEWVQDIKKNQLPNLIGGVGPMHSLVQLFQGIRDLFWLPIEQYQKDGRIVRGLQRGANSFTTSTAIAALEITARIVQAIQSVAETAFDMLSPGPSARRLHGKKGKRQHRYSRPADIREGLANAYSLVKEGLGETAETLVRVASVEAEQKGAVGAVGGVLRQIPPTVVAPIILASAATSNLLGGVKSQLAPDARREESNKWRTDENY